MGLTLRARGARYALRLFAKLRSMLDRDINWRRVRVLLFYSVAIASGLWCILRFTGIPLESPKNLVFATSVDWLAAVALAWFASEVYIRHHRGLLRSDKWKYWPPPLFAAAAAAAILTLLALGAGWIGIRTFLFILGVGAVPIIVLWTAIGESRTNASSRLQTGTTIGSINSEARDEQWLDSDDLAIGDPQDDLFGHSAIAERITDLLRPGTNGTRGHRKIPTIALIGLRGTGKTSIGNLVRSSLQQPPSQRAIGSSVTEFIWVPISCWSHLDSASLIEEILSRVCESICENVDAPHLRVLSKKYIDLITAGGGPWGIVGTFLEHSSSPEQLLRQIDEVLATAKLRVVLWIDDLERYIGAERAENDGGIEAIYALLWHLRELDHVTYVLALGASSGTDVAKLVSHYEAVPRLSPSKALPVVARFIQRERGKRSGLYVLDDASTRRMDGYGAGTPIDSHMPGANLSEPLFDYQYRGGTKYGLITTDFLDIVTTPRILKMVLRDSRETWRRLAGEARLDEIVAVNALRHAEETFTPASNKQISIWESLLLNPGVFTRAPQVPHGDSVAYGLHGVMKDRKTPAARLLNALVNRQGSDPAQKNAYQSIGSYPLEGGPNYFLRIATGRVSDEQFDQAVFGAIYFLNQEGPTQGSEGDELLRRFGGDLAKYHHLRPYLRFLNPSGCSRLVRLLLTALEQEWPAFEPSEADHPILARIRQHNHDLASGAEEMRRTLCDLAKRSLVGMPGLSSIIASGIHRMVQISTEHHSEFLDDLFADIQEQCSDDHGMVVWGSAIEHSRSTTLANFIRALQYRQSPANGWRALCHTLVRLLANEEFRARTADAVLTAFTVSDGISPAVSRDWLDAESRLRPALLLASNDFSVVKLLGPDRAIQLEQLAQGRGP